jgi:putative ABC transport system ATP-binding protein
MVSLLIRQNQQETRHIRLYKTETTIGRTSECDIQLPDPKISRKHARITLNDGTYYLEDLKSSNGVFLSGAKVHRTQLRSGDKFTILDYQLEFIVDDKPDAEPAPAIVEVRSVSKEYALGKQTVSALRNISLEIHKGEFMALAGPSGSGKSTLLNLIGCIDTPTSGSILIEGRDVSGNTADELADLRLNTLGFVFQTFNLLPVLSAWENVEYPMLQQRFIDRKTRQERIQQYLNIVGLERYVHHRPNELSGGQRQRVAIARALATHPGIVLADEPTANLDRKTGEGILKLMKKLNQDEGTTFIFSTHDARVMEMADRVIDLADGQILA